MELDKKSFSIRRHITLVLTLLTVLIVLLIGVCVAVVREQSRIRLTSAADSYLSLLTRTLENQLVIQESYITSQVLNSEELHRLGFGEGHTQAYLDSYKLHTGFSSAMAAGNDVTALYLYSEPNSILMSEYATAQAGRPTETQIQKTNLEETLRSMVDAKTLNDERWTPYVVSGQQYWVRAVHYYGAWLISVVNLDRQCSQATDGMLAFAQPDGVLLAGTRPEEGELSHYISLTAETEGLVLEYYVPSTDMDLDNAMNLALAVGITAVLAAICFVIWYLCSNVVHPLDALVDAMRRISAGDLSVRADWNPVNLELQQVKEAFNVMLNEIETLKIEQYEQKLDAERQEMAALKMQIRPHFFLNNLKLIYALAETGQTQQIQRMILLLSKHLRYVMDYKRETTSLRDETNFCQNYMEMTGIGQKFPPICRVTVSLDLQEMQLPAMTLLTLAENSVKHATRPDRPLTVQITAKSLPMEGEKLVNITVRDNGDGFPEEVMKELNSGKQMATGHYGLTNVQRRCALLFGPDFAMTFTNAAAGGAVVEMYIPLPGTGCQQRKGSPRRHAEHGARCDAVRYRNAGRNRPGAVQVGQEAGLCHPVHFFNGPRQVQLCAGSHAPGRVRLYHPARTLFRNQPGDSPRSERCAGQPRSERADPDGPRVQRAGAGHHSPGDPRVFEPPAQRTGCQNLAGAGDFPPQ